MKRGPRRRVLLLDRDDGVRAELGCLFEADYDVSSFESTEAAVAAPRSADRAGGGTNFRQSGAFAAR